MKFDRLVEGILKENKNKDVFVVIYDDIVINEGDIIPIESLLNKNMGGPLTMHGKPVSWKLERVYLTDVQPKILEFNGGKKSVAVPDAFNEGMYFSIVRDNDKIDVNKMLDVTSYNVTLEPYTDSPHVTSTLTSRWIVHQSNNNDGTHTTWYNPIHRADGSSVIVDFEIHNKREHEKKTTIATHKDHNPFIDLIEL